MKGQIMKTDIDNNVTEFPRGTSAGNRNKLLVTAAWQKFPKPYRKGDIWLGRGMDGMPIGVSDDRHIFTAASNRAGKGSGLIIPNLCLWEGSTVVIDPKGENCSITARNRAKMKGHKVVAIDPYNEAKLPDDLLGYINPLDFIDITDDDAIDIAGMIADSLILKANAKDAHWDESAAQLISGIILHVCENEPAESRNLGRVRQLLVKGDPEFRDVMELESDDDGSGINNFEALWAHMASCEAVNPHTQDAIVGAGQMMLTRSPNETSGILSTASRNTRFLSTPRIAKALSKSNFDIDALKTSKAGLSIYLCLPARMFPTHARFLRLIISLLLFRMGAIGLKKPKSGQPVLFILDEFASLGHMDLLEKAAGLMAGYGVKLWTIVQDLTQLKYHYRQSWETFLANSGTSLFFANSDMTTLDWVSRRMGDVEIIRETTGRSAANSKGTSTTNGTSQSEGQSHSNTETQGQSDMAPLNRANVLQSGQTLMDIFAKRFKSSLANSFSRGHTKGGSTQSSQSTSEASNASESESTTTTEQILKTRLMSPDEFARHFDRETGLSVAFVGGNGPYVIKRTPYYSDPMFKGLYTEIR